MIENHTSYPLSPLQQGMLYHTLAEPGSGVDIQQIICSANEAVNRSSFQKAWESVIERHPVLRTRFAWEDLNEPVQMVEYSIGLPFDYQDWRISTIEDRENMFEKFIHEDRLNGFSMRQAPMMRVALFRFEDQQYRFVWTFHHAILDGRSDRIILQEFFSFYDALIDNQSIQIDLPRPYEDYIQWIEQKDNTADEQFWRETLKGFDSPTPLYLDRGGRDSVVDASTGVVEEFLSESQTDKIEAFAQENDVTLNTILQGAWALLLSHYSGKQDVVFGATRACRYSTIENAASMVGLFINTLPVRVEVKPDQKLRSYLKNIREKDLDIRKYENAPLTGIHRWSDITHGVPLFESIVVFEKGSLNHHLRAQGGRWLNWEFARRQRTGYPLNLIVFADRKLWLRIEFEKRRFDRENIVNMIGHLKTLLNAMPQNPDRLSVKLPYLTEDEYTMIVDQWNRTSRDYPLDKTLVDLFEKQVERNPDAVAVKYQDLTLTYRQLDSRANQLGHYLRKLEVGPEVLVGLFMERSPEMVTGIYGILKSGGAYVPLDPEYPSDRLEFMMEDTRAPVILTQKHLKDRLPPNNAQVICLDTDWGLIENEPIEKPASGLECENLAYVIYTSGSTGKPKGVMNEHRGIVNRLLWMQETYPLTADDRVLQKTPFSFDVSVWEFFWPLQTGARLVIARPGGHRDGDYLIRLIRENEITTLHFVPSMLQLFLEEDEVESCRSIRRVICSGEALPYDLQQEFFRRLHAELHNLYGPTEAAVDVSYWICQQDSERTIVPIGFPIANTSLYILDPSLQPMPVGCTGELHIGGVQVARGYWNRPDLTVTKFIPDPFSKNPKDRLYKTGDLARHLPDGCIEYLGRIDFQVKIRGLRVELGEIETQISHFEGINQCVVTLREERPGDTRLAAYYVTRNGDDLQVVELRKYLLKLLPDYMVPHHFVKMDEIPLSPNGKIDRRALPQPQFERIAEADYVAPSSSEEKIIANIWRRLLHLDKIGVHDSFFELGGHSLLLIRMLTRLRKHFEKDIKITDLFSNPTIRKLVEFIQSEEESSSLKKVLSLATKQRAMLSRQKRISNGRRILHAK